MTIMQSQMQLRYMMAPGSLFSLFLYRLYKLANYTSIIGSVHGAYLNTIFTSGGVHFMASNNDCGVRDFDMERFQLSKQFCFPWPVNVSTSIPGIVVMTIMCCRIGGRVN